MYPHILSRSDASFSPSGGFSIDPKKQPSFNPTNLTEAVLVVVAGSASNPPNYMAVPLVDAGAAILINYTLMSSFLYMILQSILLYK